MVKALAFQSIVCIDFSSHTIFICNIADQNLLAIRRSITILALRGNAGFSADLFQLTLFLGTLYKLSRRTEKSTFWKLASENTFNNFFNLQFRLMSHTHIEMNPYSPREKYLWILLNKNQIRTKTFKYHSNVKQRMCFPSISRRWIVHNRYFDM